MVASHFLGRRANSIRVTFKTRAGLVGIEVEGVVAPWAFRAPASTARDNKALKFYWPWNMFHEPWNMLYVTWHFSGASRGNFDFFAYNRRRNLPVSNLSFQIYNLFFT